MNLRAVRKLVRQLSLLRLDQADGGIFYACALVGIVLEHLARDVPGDRDNGLGIDVVFKQPRDAVMPWSILSNLLTISDSFLLRCAVQHFAVRLSCAQMGHSCA